MNLEIVPYEVAVDLKKLGFDWKCDYLYDLRGIIHISGLSNSNLWDECAAPYQAMICKWLRYVHDIFIDISKDNQNMFDVVIRWNNHWKPVGGNMGGTWHFYEQAELAGIKKAIEILKERHL